VNPSRDRFDSTIEGLPTADQERLAQILDDYLVAAELGRPISPDELFAQHPEDADRLRGYLSGLELFHQAAVAPGSSTSRPSLLGRALAANDSIGDFRLLREIGRGGMGVVYEAEQLSLRRRVALKILPFTASHDEKQIGRFKNEAQAAAQIKHPHIVPVYGVGDENGVHFYAMQLIEGHSLSSELPGDQTAAASTASNRDLTAQSKPPAAQATGSSCATTAGATQRHVNEVARLGIQAAEALHAAHEYGIVHRDVKPSNLLVDGDGKLWVTDFGLARCRENDGLTRTGDVLGTMRYMSPEQALGRGGLVDHRSDIYSLGVTLYELATHHHPAGDVTDAQLLLDRRRFASKPLQHWNCHIPNDFQTIILKSIAEFPGERYVTAQEMADDLNRFREGKPILASPPSLASQAAKWLWRHRSVAYAAAAVLLFVLVGQFVNTLVLALQKRETEHALATAQENMRQALSVLEQFGTSYPEQLAAVPGAETIRARMLKDSLKYYELFEAQTADDPALAIDLALNYDRMGTLRETLGQDDVALEKHLAARRIWESRVADAPENADAARNLALCENNIALLESASGHAEEAIESLEHARRIQQDLLSADPASTTLATELATTCNNLGRVLQDADRPSEAMEQFRLAVARQEPLVTRRPHDEAALRVLAAAHTNLGSLPDGADPTASAEHFHQAIELQRRLAKGDPINRLYQGDLARSYNNLGYALVRTGDLRNAELSYVDAIRLQARLVEKSPQAGSYARDLAISYNNLGMLQSRDARLAEAEQSFQQAVGLQQRLLDAAPNNADALSNLGGVYNNLGLLFDAQQRYADAETNYQQAINHQRQALDESPANPRYRELLANHYANFAKCLAAQQKQQAAEQVVAERNSLLALGRNRKPGTPKN